MRSAWWPGCTDTCRGWASGGGPGAARSNWDCPATRATSPTGGCTWWQRGPRTSVVGSSIGCVPGTPRGGSTWSWTRGRRPGAGSPDSPNADIGSTPVYLKWLTLKGFKSFAAPATLRFEPGICAVVGPNGSGKSNVVDALTWVMGEHSVKSLRGGKMQDVIFAGTSGKSPLGRAEVTLTLDNSDGACPIHDAEVSLTRRMFRDGAAEYEINGDRARLMDVQELLSDSGIGREMHVVVGQGKLSEILESKPEERRAFIEDA